MTLKEQILAAIKEYTEKQEAKFLYQDPLTQEIFSYQNRGFYKKNGRVLIYKGEAKDRKNER